MKYNSPDYVLIVTFVILIILGLFVLASASYFVACEKFNDCYFYLKHQLLYGLLPGVVFFLFLSFFNFHHFKKLALPLLILTILLLIAVFIPHLGFAKGEARRWIKIGSFIFQPSEIAKLTFLIYLSAWMTKHIKQIKDFKQTFIPFVILLSLISILIILQPDVGTLMVIISSSLVIYFIAGARWVHLTSLVTGLIAILLVLIKIAPYRLARITAFLNPEIDPQGIGYHISQAIIAVSSGGFFGRGLGHSYQKIYYLPEVISDSIFAVMAEEFGFIPMIIIIGLYIFLTYRIFYLAGLSKDTFAQLLTVGIGFWFIFQTMLNMGAMLGLLPLTGIPLPLIGYGGTNLAIFLAAFGILINISRQVSNQETS
ncbi:cell division protein FtsW [Patescibacteria group bacterium]|nr:cell division protein FtsW [Patescibacteria group bacterium]